MTDKIDLFLSTIPNKVGSDLTIPAVAALAKQSFIDAMQNVLDEYLHFGAGRDSGVVWSGKSEGESETGLTFDLTDLREAEDSYNPSTFDPSTGSLEINRLWNLEKAADGEVVFSMIFKALKPASIGGLFARRTETHDELGWKYANVANTQCEIQQIIESRLTPIFGKGNFEVIPLRDDGSVPDINTVSQTERFSDWKIMVHANSKNVVNLVKAMIGAKNGCCYDGAQLMCEAVKNLGYMGTRAEIA